MWIPLAFLGALTQALNAAIKKKSLMVPEMNTVIGTISFLVAGVAFWIFLYFQTGEWWRENLSLRFWHGMFWYASLALIAAWYGYKAVDLAEFSFLGPFISLTSLTIVIPPIFILGEVPSPGALLGIALVAFGSLVMTYRRKSDIPVSQSERERRTNNRRGLLYFLISAACFTITPTAAKVAIQESSAVFTSFLVHMLIGAGFLVMTFAFQKRDKLVSVLNERSQRKYLLGICAIGLLVFIGNGSINAALSTASVSSVMAIKRISPLFSFLIALSYFKERTEIPKKLVATALMVAGAVLVTIL